MTANERLEKLLNRAGQTISDLPRKWDGCVSEPYSGEQCYKAHGAAWAWYVGEDQRAVPELERQECTRDRLVLRSYILHLTDIIDRMEMALENQVTLHEKLMHVIGNADIPDSVSYDQFCLVVDSIYKAVQTAQEGWETYEEGVPEDWRADDETD